MLTIVLAVLVAAGTFCGAKFGLDMGTGWSIFFGVLGFAVFQIVFGIFIRRRVQADMEAVQRIVLAGQKGLQTKMARWQFRPPSSQQAAQRELLEDSKVFVGEAIEKTKGLRKYRLWVPMIERQIATAQFQLYWSVKEFRKVDELLPKVFVIDPTLAAMKMARLYMTDRPTDEIGKVYAKAVRRLRYNQNVLLAACWSWILVKRNDPDAAFKALTEALKSSDDATLKRNHECLMNNRVAHFNNSGLGDKWYALQLEEPRTHAPRQHAVYR